MIKPLSNRVIVERIESESESEGGIIIPDVAKEPSYEGRVMAVGPGLRDEKGNRIPLDVSEGDVVLFSKFAGSEVTIDGEDYLIIQEDDILAILE